MQTSATFETPRAERYLKTLCHHFGRKVAAECDDTKGWIEFPFGRCEMEAEDGNLELHATADSARGLAQVTQIITSHLERFAFRENPTLNWHQTI